MTATPSPIRVFEPEGRAIPYVDEGEGPSLVLVPGARLNLTYLGTLAHVLEEEGFRVTRVGFRGASREGVTLHDLAQDVVDVMDHLGLGDAWVGGHSFGGTVARTVALDHHERIFGLLLLGVDGAQPATTDAARALDTLHAGADESAILAGMGELAGAGDAAVTWSILRQALDADVAPLQEAALAATPESEWTALEPTIPVLVIQGSDDRVTVPANGEALRDAAPALVSVSTLDGGGHFFPVTHPGETGVLIEDFLGWD